MPYVAPGLPPSSAIPKPVPSLTKDDTDSSHDLQSSDSEIASTDPSIGVPTAESPALISSPTQLQSASPPSPNMIPSSPSGTLSHELSSLDINPPPSSAPNDSPLDADVEAEPSRRGSEHSTKTTGSVPALDPHSASSSSIDSMGDSGASTPGTTTGPTSPLRVVNGLGDDGRDGDIARYREGLYAYTRGLYLEAKLSVSKEEKRRSGSISSNGFAPKQSGMEKLAAKKALAKRLNAGNYDRD